jgi:hypothetical protein
MIMVGLYIQKYVKAGLDMNTTIDIPAIISIKQRASAQYLFIHRRRLTGAFLHDVKDLTTA